MTSPIDISPDHMKTVCRILQKHLQSNVNVWVFGSRAKWTTHDGSDLDLAVEGDQLIDHDTMTNLSIEFDDSDLPYTVDVIDLKTVSSKFKKLINTQRIPLLFVNQDGNLKIQSNETRPIPENWIHVIFSDVIDINPKRNLKKGAVVKFVSMENLKPLARTVSNYTIKNYSGGSKFQNGDTLFARITPSLENGKTAYVDFLDEGEVGAGSTEFLILTPKDKRLDPLFVYYLSRTTMVRDIAIKSMTGTSGRQRVEADIFKKINVTIPSILEQKTITKILSDLDSKIELNYQTNKTLDEMARALFKSWFVDFDPVRAKMDGRWHPSESLPGLPAHLYDLFPDCLVDSELGEIPKRWEVKLLGDITEVVGGTTPSTKIPEYWDEGIHCWVTPKDLSNLSSPVLLNTERKITDAGLQQISSGLLSPGTVLMSSRAPIGYLTITEIPVAINQGFIAMLPHTEISRHFLHRWCEVFHNEIVNYANGSTFLEINKSNFRKIPIVTPDAYIMSAYHKLVSTLHNKIVVNERSSYNLITQRNTLLPRLMSRKMRVLQSNYESDV